MSNFRMFGHISCLGAAVLQIFNSFQPSYEAELLLWVSICFFAWDKK